MSINKLDNDKTPIREMMVNPIGLFYESYEKESVNFMEQYVTKEYGLIENARECPFCGDKFITAKRKQDGLIYIGCQTCNCFGCHENHKGTKGTLEEAIKLWNGEK